MFVIYTNRRQNMLQPAWISVGSILQGSGTFQDGTPQALASMLSLGEEQSLAPSPLSLWE